MIADGKRQREDFAEKNQVFIDRRICQRSLGNRRALLTMKERSIILKDEEWYNTLNTAALTSA